MLNNIFTPPPPQLGSGVECVCVWGGGCSKLARGFVQSQENNVVFSPSTFPLLLSYTLPLYHRVITVIEEQRLVVLL